MSERLARLGASRWMPPVVFVWRGHPAAAAAGVATTIVAVAAIAGPDVGTALPVSFLVGALSYACGAHARVRDGLLATFALAVACQIGAGFVDFPNVEILFFSFGPWAVGDQVRRRRRLVSELARRAAELEAEEDAFARLAVRRERVRIARELHDIVAHHLAVIAVQAGAGRMAPAGQNELAAERLASVRQAGAEALEELDRLVDVLDVEAGDRDRGLARLRVLLAKAGDRGVNLRVTALPANAALAPEIEEAAFRVVQEGLTNAIKHARGARVEVCVAIDAGELTVEVRDDGGDGGSALAATGAGLGLTGMRERIERLGGRLDAGPAPDGGWRVRGSLPLAESLSGVS